MAQPITPDWIQSYADSKKRKNIQEIVDTLVKEHMRPDYDTILALLKEKIGTRYIPGKDFYIEIDYYDIIVNTCSEHKIEITSEMLNEAYNNQYKEWFAKYFPSSNHQLFIAYCLSIWFKG